MVFRFIAIGAISLALFGCAAQPDLQAEPESPAIAKIEPDFYAAMTDLHAAAENGDEGSRRRYVDRVLSNMAVSNAPMMFAASQFALSEQWINKAAYLFYAGRLRLAADRYAYGLSDPKVSDILNNMASNAGSQVNPLIMRRPSEYADVVSQLYAWDMSPATNYNPGWAGALQVSVQQQSQQASELKKIALSEMDALVFLLNIPAYHRAFLTVQSYNRLPEQDRGIEENIEIVQKAMAVMSGIEAREGVYVFSQPAAPQ